MSVLFFPLNFLVGLALLFLLIRWSRRAPGAAVKHLIAGGVGLATVATAMVLPVKQLDGRVEPLRYDRISLDELCLVLRRDHRIFVSADRWAGTNVLDSFSTECVMTRREILEKLAQAANCDLKIGYCETGATVLFGAHPSFTRLHATAPQPQTVLDN